MRPVFSVALLATLLLAIGCNGNDSSTPTQSPSSPGSTGSTGTSSTKYRIAVIPKGTSHDFWLSVRHGAETAAKELGNVEVIWKGTQKEDNKEGQIQILDSFIVQGVDGICLAPPVISRAVPPSPLFNVPSCRRFSGINLGSWTMHSRRRRPGATASARCQSSGTARH